MSDSNYYQQILHAYNLVKNALDPKLVPSSNDDDFLDRLLNVSTVIENDVVPLLRQVSETKIPDIYQAVDAIKTKSEEAIAAGAKLNGALETLRAEKASLDAIKGAATEAQNSAQLVETVLEELPPTFLAAHNAVDAEVARISASPA